MIMLSTVAATRRSVASLLTRQRRTTLPSWLSTSSSWIDSKGGLGDPACCRFSSTSTDGKQVEEQEEPRESMAYDVLIVGGGPAGLAASIRLKQLCQQHDKDLSVCLIDKGSEIGSHILSGNVFDPRAMNELFPERINTWMNEFQEIQSSFATPVKNDEFQILTFNHKSFTIPNFLLPPQLHNNGNYIISLSQFCRYLAKIAEDDYGVEIYPGFAASEILYDNNNTSEGLAVKGIATRDVGIGKDGIRKENLYERGMELHAKQTFFAEGARGSCSEELMKKFNMRSKSQPQTYGLGIKEVWEIPKEQHQPGLVIHTLGYPLQSSINSKIFGGCFLYHQEPNLVLMGMVIGLDYDNPYINPYQEFQQWKTHDEIKKHIEDGGTCISYGARVLNEGGYHSLPTKLVVPGAAILGCSAGFLNAVKIKGTHTAMKSGMLAAEAAFESLTSDADDIPSVAETGELDLTTTPQVALDSYPTKIKESWIEEELYTVRNCHQAFSKWGVGGGLAYTGIVTHLPFLRGKEPWTLSHGHDSSDAACTKPKSQYEPKKYPAPDGILTFDLLTNLQRSGTYHEEDQPSHLKIKPSLAHIPKDVSLQTYAAPETRFCPAGVYEYPNDEPDLVINAQNCIHCKCCSIKMHQEYIDWTVPEGGGGPQYQVM